MIRPDPTCRHDDCECRCDCTDPACRFLHPDQCECFACECDRDEELREALADEHLRQRQEAAFGRSWV